ncbi:MAG: IclR family transcriptional regulator [Actinomycetota bacterium]|nr:IclR family transcriptional regulator [Actinomycetota bacterium]
MRTLETVDRALVMLLAFDGDERRELTVAALAAHVGVHRSSASRLAATLAQRGFLERAPGSEAFRLGPAIRRLGLLGTAGASVVDAAQEPMERLAEDTSETVVLSVPEGDEVVDVAQVSGPYLVGARNWVGRRTPANACSDGKVLLAFGAAGPADRPGAAASGGGGAGALSDELAEVRARGWATAVGDLEEGLNGVAAPVWDAGGRCVAALSVSGPAYRLPPERLPEVAALVRRRAQEISARLGRAPGLRPTG